jgi:integrase
VAHASALVKLAPLEGPERERALADAFEAAVAATTARGTPRLPLLSPSWCPLCEARLSPRLCERCVHDLRHSSVAIALAAGLTLPEAAALARHANPRVTATIYAGLTDAARAGLGAKLAEAFGL